MSHDPDPTIRSVIESAFDRCHDISPNDVPAELVVAVEQVMDALNSGTLRIASRGKDGATWTHHAWVKKAILLYFRTRHSAVHGQAPWQWYDKVPLKYAHYDASMFAADGVRVAPGAIVRYGSHIAPSVVLMPCFVNVGAYIDHGSLIDSWATVGSCAQIGKNVHISGGAGIGGVLEPWQDTPTIIEDDCFIGARSEIVEGVVVEKGSVISMGVFIGQSTRIYHRDTGSIHYGHVPAGSVVVPGSLPSADGRCHLQCAVIVKSVDAQTRAKVGINALLRASLDEMHHEGVM